MRHKCRVYKKDKEWIVFCILCKNDVGWPMRVLTWRAAIRLAGSHLNRVRVADISHRWYPR